MIGLDVLTAIRKAGRIPSRGVLIEVGPVPPWQTGVVTQPWSLGDGPIDAPDTVMLAMDPGESLDLIDLRALVGLKVVVFGDAAEAISRAVRALCMRCVGVGTTSVDGIVYAARSNNEHDKEIVFSHSRSEPCSA